jgi:hypothetical protein
MNDEAFEVATNTIDSVFDISAEIERELQEAD